MKKENFTSNKNTLYNKVTCDICGEKNNSDIYKLQNTHIVKCDQCKFHYISPRIDSAVLMDKIQKWSVEDTVDDERLRIAFDKNTLKLYKKFITKIKELHHLPGKKILDIGCSVGAFLHVAKEEGFDASGLELGKASADYAEKKQHTKVANKSIFDYEVPDNSYDIVSMLEVIEHLEHPKQAMDIINKLLKPGGLVFLTTPNFTSLYQRLHGQKWWVINCEDEHIMFFDYHSMNNLLVASGFELEFLQIRGIDITGILRNYKKSNITGEEQDDSESYYEARDGKERVKAILSNLYLDDVVRVFLRGLDWLFSKKYSPLFGMGEQLIIIARKK
jgi:2-polyprenyl-3-methyl-5-hydroxy-6-metoxy-1,4-benzoquinol methylase